MELLTAVADNSPAQDKVFIAADRDWTYHDLHCATEYVAAWRQAHGLTLGQRVVVALDDAVLASLAALALIRCGLTAVMVDADSTAAEAAAMIGRVAPAAIVASPARVAAWAVDRLVPAAPIVRLGPTGEKAGGLATRLMQALRPATNPFTAFGDARQPPPADIADDTPAYVIFTSGTTLAPKGVLVTHGALRAHLTVLRQQYGYGAASRILNVLPVSHADGLVQGALLACFCGATLLRPMAFSPATIDALLSAVYARRVTHLIAVPAMLSLILRLADRSLDHVFQGGDVRCVVSTAAHLEEELWRRFEDRYAVVVANHYGLTETVSGGVFNGPDPETRRVGFLGKPAGCAIRIVSPDGNDVADGQTGEILMAGPSLMTGYVDDPAATALVLRDGWLHTGDLGRWGKDGFVQYVGRRKNLIISGGLNIQPEEVAEVIKRHPDVTEAVVVGEPHPDLGETSVAIVVAQAGTDGDAIIAHCRHTLSEYKVPRRVVLVDHLPKGNSGKVILAQAQALAAADRQPHTDDHADRVIAAAATVFRVPPATLTLDSRPHDTPGWDSLGHLLLAAALEKEFGIVLAPEDIVGITCLGDARRTVQARQTR